jgi:uncharacterized protein YjiS (DUF1127 family)
MRDYALNHALATESIGTSLLTLFRNWQARRELAKLNNSNDHTLQVVGFTRSEVQWALQLPLRDNPRLALEDFRFRRSRF